MRFLSRRRVRIAAFLVVPLVLGLWAWRAASWRPKIVKISSGKILALEWASDGRTLHCASHDGRYRLLSGSSLEVLTSSEIQKPGWSIATFSKMGKTLLTTDISKVQLWTVPTLKKLWRYDEGAFKREVSSGEVPLFALSANGYHLACAEIFGNHGAVWVWDVKNGRVQVTRNDDACAYSDVAEVIALSPSGNLVAYGGETPGIGVWSKQTHKRLWDVNSFTTTNCPKKAAATALCFSPDGQRLAASFLSGETMLLNARTGTVVRTFVGTTPGQCLAFSPDGQLLAWTGNRGEVKVWNVATGQAIVDAPSGGRWDNFLAFSPDSSRLTVGTEWGQVQLWRVR